MTDAVFCSTLFATCGALIWIARRESPVGYWRFAALLIGWIAITGYLAGQGALTDFERRPPVLPLLIVTAIVTATAIAVRMGDGVPLAWLIGYQAFRIPVEIFLHMGYVDGFVPVQMSWSGRNLDVLTGLTAIPVAWMVARGRLSRQAMQLWNVAGFLLLLNIMTVAILSLPTPFRQFHNEPANVFVTRLPYVWLPAVLVPAAWFGHIALFRRIKRI